MNKREKKKHNPLDTVSANTPSDRVKELERKITNLQKDVEKLKTLSGWPYWAHEGDQPEEKKKLGPKQNISDPELFRYRDALIIWLERFWPWMIDKVLVASTVAEVETIIQAVAPDPDYRSDWHDRLLQNAAALFEFLRDERFRKTLPKATVSDALSPSCKDEKGRRASNQLPTRQIANAMAGVPEIAWRTSLDRCSAQPSIESVALNLDMHYRELLGIPAPKDQVLIGMSCPVPKPLHTSLTPARAKEVDPQIKANGTRGNENI